MPRLIRIVLPAVFAAAAAVVPHASPQTPAAGPGRPLTIEDYYRVLAVGSSGISPDGRWVSYAVTSRVEDDKESNKTSSEGWFVPFDGAAKPTRIPANGSVGGLRWLDDNWLQYSVERQQWKINPSAPAAPVRVSNDAAGPAPGGRGGRGRGAGAAATVSPDGQWRADLVDKPLPRKDPAYASDFEKRHQARFEGAIFDWKDFQRDGQPFPAPDPRIRPAQHLLLTPVGEGTARTLVDADLRPGGIAWHPNGRLLAYVADPDWRDELKYESPDLWTVSADGVVTRLTNDMYVYSDPKFSPDGTYLSYVRSFGTDMIIQQKLNHGGPRDLYIRPVAGGDPINLTESWDLDPGSAQWTPDGRFIYFTAGTGGESHLFRITVPTARVEQVTKGPRRLGDLAIDKGFTKIAYTVGLHETPGDIYVANIDGTNERRLTDLHAALSSEIAFSRAQRLEWASSDGTRIEGWLMFPHGYDPKRGPYPLIVTSHGGPHAATGYSFDFKDQYFAANGYFVLDTNFRGSTGYGDAFKWATWGAWGDKDGQDVMSGIDVVLKRYPIDATRVGHTGHSYGGFMTNWLITQYPDRFAAAISGAGISNWISDYGTADIYRTKETEFFGTPWEPKAREIMIKQSPLTHAGRVTTPTLFVHGEVDQRVPYEEAEQMYFALKRRGVAAKMIQYKGMPHGISGHWNNVHRMLNELAWWNQYLKPGSGTVTSPSGR